MERTHPACGTLASCQQFFRKEERAGCPRTADKDVGAPAKILEPVKLPQRGRSKIFPEDSVYDA